MKGTCRYSCCQILMKLEFSRQIFEKYSSTKFYENLSNVPCRWTDGQIDREREREPERESGANMTKLMPAFCNFANAPKKLVRKPQNKTPLGRGEGRLHSSYETIP
jgi:hypothetical protein